MFWQNTHKINLNRDILIFKMFDTQAFSTGNEIQISFLNFKNYHISYRIGQEIVSTINGWVSYQKIDKL